MLPAELQVSGRICQSAGAKSFGKSEYMSACMCMYLYNVSVSSILVVT